jgi:YD repeat-containing protein
LPAATYEVLFWSTGPVSVRVNGAITAAPEVLIDGPGNWRQYKTRIPVPAGGVATLLSASGGEMLLDELRLHPVVAQVTTYTHEPLVGLTSQTNATGRTITYEYDALGRLQRVRDEQGRVLSEQQYHYAGH